VAPAFAQHGRNQVRSAIDDRRVLGEPESRLDEPAQLHAAFQSIQIAFDRFVETCEYRNGALLGCCNTSVNRCPVSKCGSDQAIIRPRQLAGSRNQCTPAW
jgi:hypothetical protein